MDLRLDDMSEARSALATPGHQSPDLTEVPAESEEEKLQREVAEEQERLLKEEQAAKVRSLPCRPKVNWIWCS